MSAIFGTSAAAESSTSAAPASGTAAPSSTASQPGAAPATVDVAAVLDGLAKQKKQKLNWRTSIVDLMKLLDLDSSSHARKELAEELHYSGDMKDSAKMNVWLHKQVIDQACCQWRQGAGRLEALVLRGDPLPNGRENRGAVLAARR
jgi:hypothetical protein